MWHSRAPTYSEPCKRRSTVPYWSLGRSAPRRPCHSARSAEPGGPGAAASLTSSGGSGGGRTRTWAGCCSASTILSHTPRRARLPGRWQGSKPTSNSAAAGRRTPRRAPWVGAASKLCCQRLSSSSRPERATEPPAAEGGGSQSLGRQPEPGVYQPGSTAVRARSCTRRTAAALTVKATRSVLPCPQALGSTCTWDQGPTSSGTGGSSSSSESEPAPSSARPRPWRRPPGRTSSSSSPMTWALATPAPTARRR
jgi:hypothetical protein